MLISPPAGLCPGLSPFAPLALKQRKMNRLHKYLGLIVIVIFLLTGQYMDFYYPDKEVIGEGMRMMLRSRHIYILLIGLINLGIGIYFVWHAERWRRLLQWLGSILILAATGLSIGAFFYEPPLAGLQRTLTLPALESLLAGTLLHLFSGKSRRQDSGDRTQNKKQL